MRVVQIIPPFVASVAMVLMMIHVTVESFSRYFLNSPLPATTEIVSLYYMVPLSVLPLASLLAKDELIKVEIVSDLSTLKWRRILVFIGDATILVVSVLATYWMAQEALKKARIGEVWEGSSAFVTAWPSRWFMPLGFGLLALVAAVRVLAFLRGRNVR